jgi:hypothetical protein
MQGLLSRRSCQVQKTLQNSFITMIKEKLAVFLLSKATRLLEAAQQAYKENYKGSYACAVADLQIKLADVYFDIAMTLLGKDNT